MEPQIIEDMKNLSALNFTSEAIKAFLTNYSLDNILRKFIEMDKQVLLPKNYIIKTTVEHLINDHETFEQLVSEPTFKEYLECLIQHPQPPFREMIAAAILENVDTAVLIFKSFEDDIQNEIITGYINIVYFLLKDEESSVGLKMSKFLAKFARTVKDDTSTDYIFSSKQSVEHLYELLKSDNAVISLRTFEVLVLIGNSNERFYHLLKEEGLLDAGLKLYKKYSKDILEKLNLVDIVGKMGQTQTGAELLCEHPAFRQIKKDALQSEDDPFVAKSLSVLLIDLMTYGKIKFSKKLLADLNARMTSYFLTGFGEELYSCYDMISSFGKSFEGYLSVYQNKKVMSKLTALCHSNIDMEHQKALKAINGLLSPEKIFLSGIKKGKKINLDDLNLETNNSVEFIIIYSTQPHLTDSYIDITDSTYFDGAMTQILKKLMLPFDDIEQIFLELCINMVQIDRFAIRFCKNSLSLDYLVRKRIKSSITSTLKNAFMYDIKEKFSELKKTRKDPFFDMYLTEWQNQIQQRKLELMQVASNTN